MILQSLVNNAHLQNVMIMKHGSLFQLCNPLKMKLITMIKQRTGYYYLLIQLLWSKALQQKLSIVWDYIETYNKAATAVTYIWSKDFSPLPALFADFILIIGPGHCFMASKHFCAILPPLSVFWVQDCSF